MMFQLRHRGALLAIYPTFLRVCDKLAYHSELPKLWINDILQKLGSIEVLLTRRSGGAPFVMLAALTPKGCHKYLDWTVRTLFQRCETSTEPVIQVNNMNVLRRLFTDSQLSKATQIYVEQGFMLSFKSIHAKNWSLRNAGLMLFSTLINREFGTTKAHQHEFVIKHVSGIHFFKRFPLFFDFLLEQTDLTTLPRMESSFTLLALLSRFTHSNDPVASNYHLSKFFPFVMACSASPSWKLREMAANAMFPLISTTQRKQHCAFLYTSLIEKRPAETLKNENETHGFLLQLSLFVERTSDHGLTLTLWVSLVNALLHRKASHFSLALAYQVFHLLVSSSSSSTNSNQTLTFDGRVDFDSWFDHHWSGYGAHLARLHLLMGTMPPPFPFSFSKSLLSKLVYDSDTLVRDAAFKVGVQLQLLDQDTLTTWKDASFPISTAYLDACISLDHLPYSFQELLDMYEVNTVPLSTKQSLLIAFGHFVEDHWDETYFQLLSLTARSSTILPLREASLKSVEHYFRSHSYCPRVLWLVLTTLLHDDDPELRRATSVMLSTQVIKTTFPLHEHALFLHVLEHASTFLDLNDLKKTLQTLLVQHRQSSSFKRLLFDNEKDNTYKDDLYLCILILRTLHQHDWDVVMMLKEIFVTIESSSADMDTAYEEDIVYTTLHSLSKSDDTTPSIDPRILFIQKYYLTHAPLSFSNYSAISYAA
ncbi:hypothetical protein HMI54_006730 [Coelomomyces lativittatus]|nr:hypothetical protein HMI56_001211 [Coelomomyces lativittatus]KAJ1517152.1 hypothetical protein HMI54_006730 [Coelomomyces lativittatus]